MHQTTTEPAAIPRIVSGQPHDLAVALETARRMGKLVRLGPRLADLPDGRVRFIAYVRLDPPAPRPRWRYALLALPVIMFALALWWVWAHLAEVAFALVVAALGAAGIKDATRRVRGKRGA